MEQLLHATPVATRLRVLTPTDPVQRGAQLSLVIEGATRQTSHALLERGVYCDFREPNVIRVAPAPLYNSFHDVWRLVQVMNDVFR
jgi:kynureninase